MTRSVKTSTTNTGNRNHRGMQTALLVLMGAIALSIFLSLSFLSRINAPETVSNNAAQSSEAAPLTKAEASKAFGQLPLSFEANQGQADEAANFVARGAGYTLTLSPAEVVFALSRLSNEGAGRGEPSEALLRMTLVGASQDATVEGLSKLEGKVNYFMGKDPSRWRTNIQTFGRVRYSGVYPGVDVVYYGNQRHLEYDFVIAPGRDPQVVRLQFKGADRVEVDASGDLLLSVGGSVIRQPKPVVYQEVGGERVEVVGNYSVEKDGRVGFALGQYDASLPVVIDPTLVYSTYLGGSNTDLARAITVDSNGNAYVTGYTTSTNFPTANAIQAALSGTAGNLGTRDIFVTKLNAAGTAFVYSTYLGGSSGDEARGIAVDSFGNAYVVGFSASTNFPVVNAAQAVKGATNEDAIVTKINTTGSALIYSTYLGGGSSSEFGEAIAVDSFSNAYVTGTTFSNDFPTANPIQALSGGGLDAFVTKLNAAGSAFVYSTYLGGSGTDNGKGITIDGPGNAYVTGDTASTNFPTANAIQAANGGGLSDAFVTKINSSGTALVYSTYLGGSDQEIGEGIAVDSAANSYVTGMTMSTNFPVANALQGTNGAAAVGQDAFVTKINAAGSAFVYSTYLGGLGGEIGSGIKVDSSGNAYVVGTTGSTNTFPVANAIQCSRNGTQDVFVTKINAAGTALLYSTYFGGSGSDDGQGIAIDSSGNAYITGSTTSTDFPTLNPIQAANGGGTPFGDAFIAKLNDAVSPNACSAPTPTPTPTPTPAPGPTPRVIGLAVANASIREDADNTPQHFASFTIEVKRTGDTTAAATVQYSTSDQSGGNECDLVTGQASQRCDYTLISGTLRYAAGETSKTISVPIINDGYVEGNELFTINLSNPSGGTLGGITQATITIEDDDTVATTPQQNPYLNNNFFVRQNYLDYLSREPDQAGFADWTNVLNNCGPEKGFLGAPKTCDRAHVTHGFFGSTEFIDRGYLIHRMYEVGMGRLPFYVEFMPEMSALSGFNIPPALQQQNLQDYLQEFTSRSEFQSRFQGVLLPSQAAQFIQLMEQVANVTLPATATTAPGQPQQYSRQELINLRAAGTLSVGQTLKAFVEQKPVYDRYFERGHVTILYFAHLRRDPRLNDPNLVGWRDWVDVFTNGRPSAGIPPRDIQHLIFGFIYSIEYRKRFGQP